MSLRAKATGAVALLLTVGLLTGGPLAVGAATAAGISEGRAPARAGAPVAAEDLPLGEAPAAAWLAGRMLHTAAGRTIRIPIGKDHQNSLELLGRTKAGWVLAHHWNSTILVVSPAGRVVRNVYYGTHEEYPGNGALTLSGNGRLVAVLAIDRGGQTRAVALNLRGKKVAARRFGSGGIVLGTRGRTFFVGLAKKLVAWRPGAEAKTPVRARVDALDLEHGLVMRHWRAGEAREALAPLRQPKRVRWTMPTSLASTWAEFSPDGRHLLLQLSGRRLQVRSVADGSVALDLRFKPGFARLGGDIGAPSIRWEDRSHLLVDVRRAKRHTLVRCDLDGRCERALRWRAHPLLGWDYTRTA